MKKLSLLILLIVCVLASVNAQSVNGDMNHDGNVSMADANAVVNIFVNEGKYEVLEGSDNKAVEGTWYLSNIEFVTFCDDGTVGFEGASYTYKYMPALSSILLYEANAEYPSRMLSVSGLNDNQLGLVGYGEYYRSPKVFKATQIILSTDEVVISMDVSTQITATVLPEETTDKGVVWTSSDTNIATVSSDGVVKCTGRGKAIITATAADGGGATASVVLLGGGYYEYEAVDLGLSVKWAATNLGATSKYGYGKSYAWAELEAKKEYTWSTYKWCNGSASTLTKYYRYSYAEDERTVVEPADDAAHVLWGGNWRMPTKDELTELMEKCTWEKVSPPSKYGINGYRVTGPNGNSIFLPFSGFRENTSTYNMGDAGYYWTSTRLNIQSELAWMLYMRDGSQFDGNDCFYMNGVQRYLGYSIRPVCP